MALQGHFTGTMDTRKCYFKEVRARDVLKAVVDKIGAGQLLALQPRQVGTFEFEYGGQMFNGGNGGRLNGEWDELYSTVPEHDGHISVFLTPAGIYNG